MVFAHLGLARRDGPQGRFEIEFVPFGVAQLARADEYMRGQLHRQLRNRLTFVTVDGTQQLAHTRWVDDCALVGDGRRCQSAA